MYGFFFSVSVGVGIRVEIEVFVMVRVFWSVVFVGVILVILGKFVSVRCRVGVVRSWKEVVGRIIILLFV